MNWARFRKSRAQLLTSSQREAFFAAAKWNFLRRDGRQKFVPPDEHLEKAILSVMRLPLLFDDFSPDDENASLHILSILSRYENVDDLSVETVETLLSDRAPKAKLEGVHNENEELTLVREALIEHTRRVEEEHKKILTHLNAQIELRDQRAVVKEQEVSDLKETIQREIVARQADAARVVDLEATIETMRSEAEQGTKKRSHMRRFFAALSLAVVAEFAGSAVLIWQVVPVIQAKIGFIESITFAIIVPLLVICRLLRVRTSSLHQIQDFWAIKLIIVLDRVLWALAVIVCTAILFPYLYDLAKPYLPFLHTKN